MTDFVTKKEIRRFMRATRLLKMVKLKDGKMKKCLRNNLIIKLLNTIGIEPNRYMEILSEIIDNVKA